MCLNALAVGYDWYRTGGVKLCTMGAGCIRIGHRAQRNVCGFVAECEQNANGFVTREWWGGVAGGCRGYIYTISNTMCIV